MAFKRRTDPLTSCSSGLVRPVVKSLSTVSLWRTKCRTCRGTNSSASTRPHGTWWSPHAQLGVDAACVVFDPVSPLGCHPWRKGWTGTLESQSFDFLFHVARVCFPRELQRAVLLMIWSCLFRSAAPIICVKISYLSFNFLDQPLSVLPGALDSDVIIMDRSADSPRLFGVQARVCIPSSEQRHGCRPSSFSAAHCRLPDPPPSPSGSSM